MSGTENAQRDDMLCLSFTQVRVWQPIMEKSFRIRTKVQDKESERSAG
jgi:hypothetical protein